MNTMQLSLFGISHPGRAFDELLRKPAPQWGLWAILVRWVGASLTVGLLALFVMRVPTTPSSLNFPFLTDENYYLVSIFWGPVFGLAIWLLWGAFAHVWLRLAGYTSDFDHILNMIGLASLIPAPFVWIWDSLMIIMDRVRAPEAGVGHMILALWGLSLLTIGFKRNLQLGTMMAASLSVALLLIYIPLAMLWIR